MARPKKDIESIKAIITSFRLSVDQYLALAHNAESLGITIPDYIRKKISGRPLPRTRISPENRKLFVELSRIGNNINQLTRNSHLKMHAPKSLFYQLEELRRVLHELKSEIKKQ
ncbi:plasmid mobilization protein [Maribacter sp. Hel_I_7]|uniref:plasmid mobilization protein n=1 Tax=Maribacter sp. Hel_I_7 TaxID=1249997 RepID=UPI0009DCFB47|nr:plasmid mobilization relaxosome protein MobC [Maribacter sp. Hel_I_7]|tara:strand:+ start:1813 stop:2154 length:342 start_codon:yes stop_codon:yes gene_type:complete